MRIADIIPSDAILNILEVYDVGSRKDKDVGQIRVNQETGDVTSVCGMCNGSGNMVHKNSLKFQPGGNNPQRKAGQFGGECGTCHGKGVVVLYNIKEVNAARESKSIEELQQNAPDIYDFLKRKSEVTPTAKQILLNLDNGISIPEKQVDSIIRNLEKEKNPQPETLKGVTKDDGRFRGKANRPAHFKR
jgi:hypothetical protein